jgi:hypothetical protein
MSIWSICRNVFPTWSAANKWNSSNGGMQRRSAAFNSRLLLLPSKFNIGNPQLIIIKEMIDMKTSIHEQKLFVQELIRKVIARELHATNYFDLPETTQTLPEELTQVLSGIYGGASVTPMNPSTTYVFPKFMNGDLILLGRVIPWEGDHIEGFFLFFRPERVTAVGECKGITSSYELHDLLEELWMAIITISQGDLFTSIIDRCGTVEDMVKLVKRENQDA